MQKKIAIVTGAGSGIGKGCALRLASQGYHVWAIGRTASTLDESVAEIERQGGTATAFPADIRDWARLEELARSLDESGVDLLINSAGGQFMKASADLSSNGWKSVIETNLTGSFNLCRLFYPSLAKRNAAVVLIVAAIWRKPMAGVVHSGASRAGVVQMMRTLALEWAEYGIRLNALSPGLTDTPALQRYEALPDNVPLKRLGTIDEVVDAALFLAEARYVTGEVLHVDGGFHLA